MCFDGGRQELFHPAASGCHKNHLRRFFFLLNILTKGDRRKNMSSALTGDNQDLLDIPRPHSSFSSDFETFRNKPTLIIRKTNDDPP